MTKTNEEEQFSQKSVSSEKVYTFSEYLEHLSSSCPHTKVTCPVEGCETKTHHKNLIQHLQTSCKNINVECLNCRAKMPKS